MEYLITLVHGTFAPKAPWTRDSSNFCKKVRDALGSENNVEFRTFDWTGKNSNNARLIASEGLAQMLTEQLYLDCDRKKIIIAHSHGGNIAMYALKKVGKQNEEFKLVTMATPF